MKQSAATLFFFLIVSVLSVSSQDDSRKKDPAGNWKFESLNAPEEYSSGIITITLSEEKFSTTMSFTGMEYKFIGENVRVVQDSIFFSVYIEGEDVKVSLKQEKASKMSGKAVYSEGVVLLNLKKEALESGKK